jgi:hypothetical protein
MGLRGLPRFSGSISGAKAKARGRREDQVATTAKPTDRHPPLGAIQTSLTGSRTCSALGVSVTGHAPVLALCRALVAAGHDPGRALHAFRGATLCLKVRSIDESSRLTVEDDRHGTPRFRLKRDRGYGAGAPIDQNDQTVGSPTPAPAEGTPSSSKAQ